MPRVTNLQNLAAGIPAEDDRLLAAFALPLLSGLHTPSGILPGPTGYNGEVTLLSNTSIQVNPFRAMIAGTQSAVQGDYRVVNDAILTRTIGGSDPTLSRLDLLVTYVRDTAYTPNAGYDDVQYAQVIPGTPAASPVAPATPPNALVHGTITVPPGTGTVTFTPATTAIAGRRSVYWGALPKTATFEQVDFTATPGVTPGDTAFITPWRCLAVASLEGATLYWRQVTTTLVSGTADFAAFAAGLVAAGQTVHNGFRVYDASLNRAYISGGGSTTSSFHAAGGTPGGWQTVITAASGWTLANATVSNLGNGMARVYLEATKTGSALTVGTTGDLTNVTVATIVAGWEAEAATGLPSGASGRFATFYIGTSSTAIGLASVAPGSNVAVGEVLSLAAVYPLSSGTTTGASV